MERTSYMMNAEQLKGISTVLVGVFGATIAKSGYMDQSTFELIIGGMMTSLSAFITWWRNRPDRIVTRASCLPEVDEISVNDKPIAAKTPENVKYKNGAAN